MDKVFGRGIVSPNIDSMADTGLKLSDYYVQEMCTPTRAALMTGRYPLRFGMTAFTIGGSEPWGIPLNETFLPEVRKRRFFSHLYINAIILPRQARDKHRGNSKKGRFLAADEGAGLRHRRYL